MTAPYPTRPHRTERYLTGHFGPNLTKRHTTQPDQSVPLTQVSMAFKHVSA
jgi:hypothetical protein